MVVTSRCVDACLRAWMHCEYLLTGMDTRKKLPNDNADIIDECALICMGTFHAFKNRSANAHRMAVLCVGICEECAEFCESQPGEAFSRCAAACRQCSDSMSNIVFASLN